MSTNHPLSMFHRQETAWDIIRRSKRDLAAGAAAGIIAIAGVKYLCAGLLILWMMAGGQ